MNLVLREFLINIFSELRQRGVRIGIGELLATMRLDEGDWEMRSPADLQHDIQRVWGIQDSDWETKSDFDLIWKAKLAETNIEILLYKEGEITAKVVQPIAPILETTTQTTSAAIVTDVFPSDPTTPEQTSVSLSAIPPVNEVAQPSAQDITAAKPAPPPIWSNRPYKRSSKLRYEPPPTLRYRDKRNQRADSVKGLPVTNPRFDPLPRPASSQVDAYWPLSRLSMSYGWRHLRRLVPDGPADILDVEATISRVALTGLFTAPVYRKRQSNHAHLVLLIDQGGSMAPFHLLAQHLVETARQESTIRQIEVFYFHNSIETTLYRDQYLMKAVPLNQVSERWDTETSILIVSDAGSARGFRHFERIRATIEMLSQLRGQTDLLAWLNPMPEPRWRGTSAQVIADFVPMFQLDTDGFSLAIDTVRGVTMHSY